MLEDVGSSLLSERGYDSDAHIISTPTRMGGPTANRGMRRTELADLIERSQEREDSERWATSQPGNAESAESAFGMRFIPTPNSSLRLNRGPFLALRGKDGRQASLRCSSGQADSSQRVSLASSLPNLNLSSQDFGPLFPEHSQVTDASGGSGDAGVPSNRGQFMAKSRQRYGMVSSGSLPNLLTDIMVPKRRQPASSGISNGDPKSVHLGDMNISQRLASETISSEAMSNNHSITELVRRNRHDGFMPLSSDSYRQHHRSGMSNFSGHEPQIPIFRQRDASSSYSHQASGPCSANVSPRAHSPSAHSLQKGTEKPSDKVCGMAKMVSEGISNGNGSTPATGLSRSKFREHCDSGNSELTLVQSPPSDTTELGSPRKVSIGWMSGGRRVGYGYSLVSDGQDEQQSHGSDDRGQSKPGTNVQADCPGKAQQTNRSRERYQGQYFTAQEPSPVPVLRQPDYRDGQPAVLPKIKTSAQTLEGYPVPPYVQALFPKCSDQASQDNEAEALWIDERISGEFSTPETPVVRKDSFETELSPASTEASATRWAQLSNSIKVRLQAQKCEEGNRKSSAGEIVTISPDDTECSNGKTPDGSDHGTRQVSRINWPQIFLKRKDSRRKSRIYRQEPSDTSSSTYVDCEANSLGRTESTKSAGADDLVSKYRERMQMPGSFEGSRWANRSTRMLWELCTTNDT